MKPTGYLSFNPRVGLFLSLQGHARNPVRMFSGDVVVPSGKLVLTREICLRDSLLGTDIDFSDAAGLLS